MFDDTRKNWPKSLLHWINCLFLQKLLLSTPFRVLKKWSQYFYSNCQRTLWNLINCSPRFVILDKTRKNLFFVRGKQFFLNSFFYRPLRILRIFSYSLHNTYQNLFCAPISCYLTFVYFDDMVKKRPKIFSSLERLPFFQNLFFQQPLRARRFDLITSTRIVKGPC